MEKKIKKGDILIVILLLGISIIFYLFLKKDYLAGEYVIITVDKKTEKYRLSDDQTISLNQSEEIYNTIIVKDGEVYMQEASCNDQICVQHKPISKNGESIICLPNRIFIEIESDTEKSLDN